MKFKIQKMRDFPHKFDVVIEHKEGKVEVFPFNKGDGWEKEVDGEEAWLRHIKETLIKRKEEKGGPDIAALKEEYEGEEIEF